MLSQHSAHGINLRSYQQQFLIFRERLLRRFTRFDFGFSGG